MDLSAVLLIVKEVFGSNRLGLHIFFSEKLLMQVSVVQIFYLFIYFLKGCSCYAIVISKSLDNEWCRPLADIVSYMNSYNHNFKQQVTKSQRVGCCLMD